MPRRYAWRVEAEAATVASADVQMSNRRLARSNVQPAPMSKSEIGHRSAADAFVDSLGPAPKRRTRSSKAMLAKAIEDLPRVLVDGAPTPEFSERHLVALYARLHEQIYGVAPEELGEGRAMLAASSSASKLVREAMRGSLVEAIEFLRWTWRRERFVEQKRRANGETGRRIGWRLQFASAGLLTDYRVDAARREERGPARRA